jgi:N-acetylmuramoyl-L-alanine amidase
MAGGASVRVLIVSLSGRRRLTRARALRALLDRRRIVSLGLVVPALFVAVAAQAGEVLRIRYWTGPENTRVVIDLSSRAQFGYRTLTDPDRIAVDVFNTSFASAVRTPIEVEDGLIRRIRTNKLRSGTAQVVLDLYEGSEFKVFPLGKMKGYPERIVIDVMRPVSQRDLEERERMIEDLKDAKTKIVVIDPGHGGNDPGAVGRGGIREKDICLKIAKKTAEQIDAVPGFRAFLTRDADYFVPLRRRVEIAQKHRADLFVSIHANDARNGSAAGTEVFFLSLSGATDEAARRLAEKENAADMVAGVAPDSDDLNFILFDMLQAESITRSSYLAEAVHDNLLRHDRLKSRGVKQAGFVVLKNPGIPSVLVEVGFLSNAKEAKLIRSSSFQSDAAALIKDAVVDYFRAYTSMGLLE